MKIIPMAISFSVIWGKVWPFLFAVLFFGVIVALHEFGHFITAKLFDVKVNEYSIGMGPAVFKKRKGEKIRFFPTLIRESRLKKKKKAGQPEEENDESEEQETDEPLPEGVGETLYALRILPIGGYCAMEGENGDSEDTRAFSHKKPWQRFIVLAAGATLNIILGLVLICGMLVNDGTIYTNQIGSVSDELEQAENSLQLGDIIIKVDGVRVYSTRDLSYCMFYRHEGASVDVTVKRDGKTVEISDFLFDSTDENGTYFSVVAKDVTVLNCGKYAVKETLAMGKLVFLSLIDMFSGKYGLDDISGPIGTVTLVAETTTQAVSDKDYSSIFFILAFITVNIGIMNLLPLPALDGGRLFFVLIEMIIRKPVPQKFEAMVHAIGFILLLCLMALICFNDIKNLIVN